MHYIYSKSLIVMAKKQQYVHLINDVLSDESEGMREDVKRIIPILIRWAKQGQTTNTYSDLTNELGYSRMYALCLGTRLGRINIVFKKLQELTGEPIPTLNVLVVNKSTGLPSDGFSYVYQNYDDMPIEAKKIFVKGLNQKAIEYKHWDWVLSVLGLTPSVIDINASEYAIRSGKFIGYGGEGDNHKKLKEFVYYHPESVKIKDFKERKMEHILLSGDRLDVFFELNNSSKVAVEIKSSSSSDADILRGLFQCVKYKAILDAEDKVHSEKSQNKAILVIDGELSSENKKVQEALGITIFKVSAK